MHQNYYSPDGTLIRYNHHYVNTRKPSLHTLLEKELVHTTMPVSSFIPTSTTTTTTTQMPPLNTLFPFTNNFEIRPSIELTSSATQQPEQIPQTYSPIYTESTTHFVPTIPPTTESPYVRPTIAPLLSQYSQPQIQENTQMHLIIEGHSKVKTYGQNSNYTVKRDPIIVPIGTSENPVTKHVVLEDEQGNPTMVRHLHSKKVDKKVAASTTDNEDSAMKSLISLLDTSFGGLMLDKKPIRKYEKENKIREA